MRTAIYYSPDGSSFDFTVYPGSMADIDGLYIPRTDSTTQRAPFQDGATYLGTTLQEREIPITCGYVADYDITAIQSWRRTLQSVCNPKTNDRLGNGHLDIAEEGVLRRFYCRVDSVSMAAISMRKPGNEVIVTFVCSDPYAYSTESGFSTGSSVSGLAIPSFLSLIPLVISSATFTSSGSYYDL